MHDVSPTLSLGLGLFIHVFFVHCPNSDLSKNRQGNEQTMYEYTLLGGSEGENSPQKNFLKNPESSMRCEAHPLVLAAPLV